MKHSIINFLKITFVWSAFILLFISSTIPIQSRDNNGSIDLSLPDSFLNDLNKYTPQYGHLSRNMISTDKEEGNRVVLEFYDEAPVPEILYRELDIKVEAVHSNMMQVNLPWDILPLIAEMKEVRSIRMPNTPIPLEVESEGVSTLGVDQLHKEGILGDGVKVAIVDVGFDLNNPEISTNIAEARSFRSDGDITGGSELNKRHGTGVSEIIVDVAPDSHLYLYNFGTDIEFLNAMDHAISKEVEVISLSIGFVNVGPSDGSNFIDEAVDRAWEHGITVFTAAGNEAREHWSGVFIDDDGDGINEFASGDETNEIQVEAGSFVQVFLNWDDWPSSNQDYNLFIFNGAMSLAGISANLQTGSQPPIEAVIFFSPVSDTYRIVIGGSEVESNIKFHLFSFNHQLEHYTPECSLTSPADARGTLTVGAIFYNDDQIEPFSSRGPTSDGRIKPDLTAPDGVTTSSFESEPFFGTSAATPHAAGIAALLKGLDHNLSPGDIKQLLEETALDLGDPGKDNMYGAGRVDGFAAFNKAIGSSNISMLNVFASPITFQYPDLPPFDLGVKVSLSYIFENQPISENLTTPFQIIADRNSMAILKVVSFPEDYEWIEWDNYGFGRTSDLTLEIDMEEERIAIAYFKEGEMSPQQVILTIHAHLDSYQYPDEPPSELDVWVKVTYLTNNSWKIEEEHLIKTYPLKLKVDNGSWIELQIGEISDQYSWLEWDEFGYGRTTSPSLRVHMNMDKTVISYYSLKPIQTGDFTVNANPTSQFFIPGQTINYTITLTRIDGFEGEISIQIVNLPPFTTATLTPQTLKPSETTILTVQTTPNTPQGSHTLTLNASSQGKSKSIQINLTSMSIPGYPITSILTGILLAILFLLKFKSRAS